MRKSELMLSASMAIFGTIALFVKNIPLSSGEIALFRAVLALVFIAGYLIVTKSRLPLREMKKALPLLFLSGGAMGINWILLFEAYNYTSVSLATLSYYFAPVIVTVMCPILFKEKLSKKQILCFCMSTLGLVMIIGFSFGEGSSDITGILFGLGAAVFYSSVILLNKFIKNVAGIHRTFAQFVASIVVVLPYVLFSSGIHVTSLDTSGFICLLVVGLVHTGVAYIMYFSSIKDLPGQKAALLSYIDPLISVVVSSVLILKEALTPVQIVGGCLILVFALINEMHPKKQK